ncbi:MAG TPA: hypothetical protein VKT82_12645 [Ktedonobacterales bacterium]|nr:hypothetical protein [Ktedonobacterales bacterium]
MHARLRSFFNLCFCLACLLVGSLMTTSPVDAASLSPSDPLVVVVRNVTPRSGCTMTVKDYVGTPKETTMVKACPAGTLMRFFHIPRSQAVANHEAYVILPSPSSSPAAVAKAQAQIGALADEANARLLPTPPAATPNGITCATSDHTATAYMGWGDNRWNAWVQWTTLTNCKVDIYNSELQGTVSAFATYWATDKYAGWSQNVGCAYLGTNTLAWHPYTVQTAGYYYEQWLYDGSSCTIFDSYAYANLGPLNR